MNPRNPPDPATEERAAAASSPPAPPATPSELQARFGEAINSGDFSAFDAMVSGDVVDHDPAPGQERGPAGYKDFFGALRAGFPDMHVEVEHLVADGDDVAFAYTLTGTHTGEFQGHRPTGNGISVRGMQISRFADGKMVERWGATDELTMLRQLGVLDAPTDEPNG